MLSTNGIATSLPARARPARGLLVIPDPYGPMKPDDQGIPRRDRGAPGGGWDRGRTGFAVCAGPAARTLPAPRPGPARGLGPAPGRGQDPHAGHIRAAGARVRRLPLRPALGGRAI